MANSAREQIAMFDIAVLHITWENFVPQLLSVLPFGLRLIHLANMTWKPLASLASLCGPGSGRLGRRRRVLSYALHVLFLFGLSVAYYGKSCTGVAQTYGCFLLGRLTFLLIYTLIVRLIHVWGWHFSIFAPSLQAQEPLTNATAVAGDPDATLVDPDAARDDVTVQQQRYSQQNPMTGRHETSFSERPRGEYYDPPHREIVPDRVMPSIFDGLKTCCTFMWQVLKTAFLVLCWILPSIAILFYQFAPLQSWI